MCWSLLRGEHARALKELNSALQGRAGAALGPLGRGRPSAAPDRRPY